MTERQGLFQEIRRASLRRWLPAGTSKQKEEGIGKPQEGASHSKELQEKAQGEYKDEHGLCPVIQGGMCPGRCQRGGRGKTCSKVE